MLAEDIHQRWPIYSITPFTLQDFPNHTACILWFGGCNFRCAYCHNPELVLCADKPKAMQDVWAFLQSRQKLLDGVVLSGGECTLAPKLDVFVEKLRSLGFKVKLDTNGSNPSLLEYLCNSRLIDYVALDYKAPESCFEKITGYRNKVFFFQSLDYLCRKSNIPFEVRTTVHTELLDEKDIAEIIYDLDTRHFKGELYLQNFISSGETLSYLPPQKRVLDVSLLPIPKHFTIKTRNF